MNAARILGLAATGSALVLAAPAVAATKTVSVGDFREVGVAGSFDVRIATGKTTSVRAEGAQEDLDRLKIEVENGKLGIGTKDRKWSDWGSHHMGKVVVYVTVPVLNGVAVAGSGNVDIDRAKVGNFEARVAGSGTLTIGNLAAGHARFAIAGSGSVVAAGTCTSVSVSIAGSGDAALANLKCATLEAKVAGSGDVTAHASKSAAVSVMGSGDVSVTGGAKCQTKKMGSGSVRCV